MGAAASIEPEVFNLVKAEYEAKKAEGVTDEALFESMKNFIETKTKEAKSEEKPAEKPTEEPKVDATPVEGAPAAPVPPAAEEAPAPAAEEAVATPAVEEAPAVASVEEAKPVEGAVEGATEVEAVPLPTEAVVA